MKRTRLYRRFVCVVILVCIGHRSSPLSLRGDQAGARKMSARKMKDPAPKTTRDLNLKSARLFSSFLRGASYLKSPQNISEKIQVLYRIWDLVLSIVTRCGQERRVAGRRIPGTAGGHVP